MTHTEKREHGAEPGEFVSTTIPAAQKGVYEGQGWEVTETFEDHGGPRCTIRRRILRAKMPAMM